MHARHTLARTHARKLILPNARCSGHACASQLQLQLERGRADAGCWKQSKEQDFLHVVDKLLMHDIIYISSFRLGRDAGERASPAAWVANWQSRQRVCVRGHDHMRRGTGAAMAVDGSAWPRYVSPAMPLHVFSTRHCGASVAVRGPASQMLSLLTTNATLLIPCIRVHPCMCQA